MAVNGSKGFRNMTFGILAQIITIGVGIIIPRLVLVNLGSEANGLLNSVSSILTYMTLLEAGVGLATLQALYTPFANDDRDAVNRIMAATDYFYKRTGAVYLVIVILLSIGYTMLVHSELPRIYVFLVIVLAGLSGVLSYFFQGKFRILLQADGKNYVISNIATISTVGTSFLKAIVLILWANVVLVQSVYFLFNLFQMAAILLYIKKNYPWIDLSAPPEFAAISQKKAVLVHQVTELIFNNTDVIILTIFTSLRTVSVYSMYAMIFGMVKSVAVTFSDSFSYAVGQSYQDKDRFDRIFNAYEVYNMCLTFAFFCIAAILMLPFLKLYTKGVNDINYIDPYVLWLFVAFYLMQNGRKASQTVINVAQHFEKTKWRAVAEAVINLTASLLLTYMFGIYGVLWGTIIALLYRTNDVIIYAAKLLKRSPLVSYRRWVINVITFMIMVYLSTFVRYDFTSYISLVLYGCILSITIIPVFLLVNSAANPKTAVYTWGVIHRRIRARAGRA